MSNLHRTQVYVEEEQIRRLKFEAKREHLAVSKLIRKAIDRFLQTKYTFSFDRESMQAGIGLIKY